MRNILILEPDDEKVPQLVFLLNLSDIRCTVARTIEEALNWLNADQLMMTGFDLFLLNSLQIVELEKTLLAEISSAITVPVVYVQRENLPLPELLGDRIVTCHPNNLLSCLHECLVPENKRPGEDSSGHRSAD